MKLSLQLLTITGIIISSLRINLFSQETVEKPGLGRGTIENQFNYVIYRSEKVEDYKMVKSWWLYRLKAEVLDTLKEFRNDFQDTLGYLSIKETEVDSLLTVLSAAENNLTSVSKEKNNIKFIGINMDKTIYNSIVWFIIALLAVALFVFICLFKRSNAVTSRTKSDLNEIKHEYEDYRKRALIREQEVVRELYDEILKYKNKLKQLGHNIS